MVVVYGLFMAFFTTFFRETPVQEKGLETHGFSSKKRAVIIDGKHREPLNTTGAHQFH